MDIKQPAARKDLFEFVLLQLIHACAARNDHRLDVQIVERISDAVEQHAIIGDDFLSLVVVSSRGLRVATAQVAWR